MITTKNPIDIHLGSALRNFRERAGITQDKLGELVGVAAQQVQKYEVGKDRISASRLYEFAQLLEKPFASFFEGIVRDPDYHNIDFKSEAELTENMQKQDREINELVCAFSQINNFETRAKIIALLKTLNYTKT